MVNVRKKQFLRSSDNILEKIYSLHDQKYQTPHAEIAQLVNIPPIPAWKISPDNERVLVCERPGMPHIADLTKDELKLAGVRLDPKTYGPSKPGFAVNLKLRALEDPAEQQVRGLPADPKLTVGSWLPDNRTVYFRNTTEEGISLWRFNAETASVRQLTGPVLNAVRGGSYIVPFGGRYVVYKRRPDGREVPPQRRRVPVGPTVQVSDGTQSPVRTHQDLLKNEHDAALLEHYLTCEIWRYDTHTDTEQRLLPADLYTSISASPDGKYLTIKRIKRPFSYLFPLGRFPYELNIYNIDGKFIAPLADEPLADNIPQGFGAVRRGPREFQWRNDHPAQMYWVEAQDGGDPKQEVPVRDTLFRWTAPFDRAPEPVMDFALRFGGIEWGNSQTATCIEYWWKDRRVLSSWWSPGADRPEKQLLYDRSWEDRYNDPGQFSMHRNEFYRSVLHFHGPDDRLLYRIGSGASPEGNRPFIDEYDRTTGETTRLWRSDAPHYERPLAILTTRENSVITVRESRNDPPNYYLRDWQTGTLRQLSHFPDVFAPLREVNRETIQYKRSDGVELSGKLYLPPGYEQGRLPVLMWAYPREYKSAANAGQRNDSPYAYVGIHSHSPLFWVLRGYAVFDNFSMPIVGEGEEEPNETFIEQLRLSAEAAIDELDRRGVADRKRIAVGGHSYGAFMTANLLAHTDLFAAGIARSGAYNRTLTPFGFQSEERTLWEAPETYLRMSPFMQVDKIDTPLLMIHGEEDPNSGTYPMQSERMFAAMKGLGKICRLVLLPEEGHGYRSVESVLHMLWEMDRWLEEHCG